MKKRWLFILGRQADLALAELISVIKNKKITYAARRMTRDTVLIEGEFDLGDPQKLLDTLGGTIKIVEIDGAASVKDPKRFAPVIEELFASDTLMTAYAPPTGRWTFGFSVYSDVLETVTETQLAKYLHNQGIVVKEYAKSRKRSSRFVSVRHPKKGGGNLALTSVVVRKNKLLPPSGTEVVAVVGRSEALRGRTIAVQDFEAYSERDYGRPARDPRVGSLPPKLAQTLINLAHIPQGGQLHDPFVGIGTILQEALLIGYRVSGSDISAEQISNTLKNLEWLLREAKPARPIPRVVVASAESFAVDKESLDAVVTEGTLGPPENRPLDEAMAIERAAKIAELWRPVLSHVHPLLKKQGAIVCTWPVYVTRTGKKISVPLLDELATLGYRAETLLPPSLAADTSVTARGTLIYARPDQVVQREIIRLSKR
jgi:tRNA G10  N-methylase Trm11